MASTSRNSPSKRALEVTEDDGERKIEEKRPRIASDISEISDADDLQTSNVVKEEDEGNSPAEVIYELSSDNDGSLCEYFMSGLYSNFWKLSCIVSCQASRKSESV